MDLKDKRDILHQLLDVKLKLIATGIDITGIDTVATAITASIATPQAKDIKLPEFEL